MLENMLFICPKCKTKLIVKDGFCICENSHSYDRAKDGYYNLLLGNGGVHGDNKEMVDARRRFLSLGYYRPLADAVSALVLEKTAPCGTVLDAGSGEGYYTDIVESALSARDENTRVFGFDISKDAAKRAAKKNPRITYAVASSYHMPIADESVDTVFNIFSPLAIEETHRVLKSQGHFIIAIPDEDHLYELKAAIYDTPYKNTVENTDVSGFELVKCDRLDYVMPLSTREEINSLFMMTPYAYRTRPENKARISALDRLDCRAQFVILTYQKK